MEDFDFMNHLENVRPAPTWKSRRESTGGSDPISIRCYHILAGAATYLFSCAILSGAILAGAIFQVLPHTCMCCHILPCAIFSIRCYHILAGAATYIFSCAILACAILLGATTYLQVLYSFICYTRMCYTFICYTCLCYTLR